jgi:hypothetical protein
MKAAQILLPVQAKLRLWYWWLVRFSNIIHFRRRVVAGTTVLGVLWAFLATLTLSPVYCSHARIRLESDVTDIYGMAGLNQTARASDYDPYFIPENRCDVIYPAAQSTSPHRP